MQMKIERVNVVSCSFGTFLWSTNITSTPLCVPPSRARRLNGLVVNPSPWCQFKSSCVLKHPPWNLCPQTTSSYPETEVHSKTEPASLHHDSIGDDADHADQTDRRPYSTTHTPSQAQFLHESYMFNDVVQLFFVALNSSLAVGLAFFEFGVPFCLGCSAP